MNAQATLAHPCANTIVTPKGGAGLNWHVVWKLPGSADVWLLARGHRKIRRTTVQLVTDWERVT